MSPRERGRTLSRPEAPAPGKGRGEEDSPIRGKGRPEGGEGSPEGGGQPPGGEEGNPLGKRRAALREGGQPQPRRAPGRSHSAKQWLPLEGSSGKWDNPESPISI